MANPWTIASTATRHMLDANIGFGIPSDRYNVRDQYRRTYDADQRLGAGIGTALAVATPVAAGASWLMSGARVPGLAHATDAVARVASTNVARVAGIAALGAMTAVGVKKSIEIAQDDGHLGGAGTAVGILGGAAAGVALGNRFAGKYAPLVTGALAIAGGVAGHFGGKAVKIGEGHIGEAHEQAPQVDENVGDRVKSFTRGAFNHFTETGPTTQGISFGYRWGMQDAIQHKYSPSERAGSMYGDLTAAGILGGGALAIGAGLTGMSSHASAGISRVRAGAEIAGNVLGKGPLTGALNELGNKGTLAAGAAAVGIAALTTWKGFEADRETMGTGAATVVAAGVLGTTAAAAALISRSSAMRGLAAAPRAANSALMAAALIGAAASARLPIQQFVADAKAARAARGDQVDPWVTRSATGVGALGGGLGAFKGLSKFVPEGGVQLGKFHIPKGAIVGAGSLAGAAALGYVGNGLSTVMPDLKTVGISTGVGAALGAGAGLVLGGVSPGAGAVAGAVLGMAASTVVKDK